MAFEQGAGFRICGSVVRRMIPDSRKVAFLTLDVAGPRSSKKLDLRTFDHGLIDDIEALADGQIIEVTGSIEIECLKDRQRNEIKVDGRNKWFPAFTVKAIKTQDASSPPRGRTQQPASQPAPAGPDPEPQGPADDDDVPIT